MTATKSVCTSQGGFTFTEILISMALLAIITVSITQSFLVLNRASARNRVGTAAMVVAQQEIDRVMFSKPFTSATNVPQLLRDRSEGGTLATGETWADANTIIRPVGLMIGATNGVPLVQGMLLRKITKIPNSTLRQIDVVVGYNFRGRAGSNASSYTYTSQTQFEADYRYLYRTSTFRSPDE